MSDIKFEYLEYGHNVRLAYEKVKGDAAWPGVIFMGGFKSDLTGTKATALAEWARATNRNFVRFDYQGHGKSSGEFTKGTIGTWLNDAIEILDRCTEGPQIIVGSSMGGWIMLKAALARADRVRALIGIAPAPDFTEKLMWNMLTRDGQEKVMKEGSIQIPSSYGEPVKLTRELIEDGRKHLLLDQEQIPLTCPVRLIHGMVDREVPWQMSMTLTEKLRGTDVRLHLIKDGEHRLSRPSDLDLMLHELNRL